MGDNRLTRITTRTGDDGNTGLADGTRLAKTHARVAAMGAVDELNVRVGALCVVPGLDTALLARLRTVQQDLFDLGGELSLPGAALLNRETLAELEADVARWNAALPPLKEFVLPGSSEANARAHLARTACRSAEIAVWALLEQGGANADPAPARYLNRLSDWLFVLSRVLSLRDGGQEVTWRR